MRSPSAQAAPLPDQPTKDQLTNIAHSFESIFCFFIILLAFLFRDNPYLVYPEILYLLTALAVLNLTAGIVLRFPRFGRGLATLIILANCGIIAAILSYSGEQASNLWVLFLLPIYTACLLLDGRSVAWITGGAIACNFLFCVFSSPFFDSVSYFELSIKSAIFIFAAAMTWSVAVREKSSQRMLERTENYMFMFRKLIGQMDDSILVVSPGTGHMVDINGTWARCLGYGREEFKGMSLAGLAGFLPNGMIWKEFVKHVRANKSLRFECEPLRKDQSTRPMEVHVQWVSQESKDYLIAVARDITERKRAEAELHQAQDRMARSEKLAAIGRLASGVGHELRNPLGAIKNAVYYFKEIAKENHLPEKDKAVADVLQHAEKEVDIASNIISDLLDFARVVRIKPVPTDINDLIVEAKKDLEHKGNVYVVELLAVDLPRVRVDPQKLHQVIVNLANNAIQAMPSGGTLEISTRIKEGHLLIAFKDTGTGITSEDMGKLFEPLFTTKARGTGLGLTISLSIVQAHGGEIVIDSQVGQGSTFTIKIPLGDSTHDGQR